MAKLSAHDQRELIRVSKEQDVPDDDLIDWERVEKAYVDSGRVLKKRVVRFRSDGRRHDYGWKVAGRVSANATVEQVVEYYKKHGWDVYVKELGEFKKEN